MKKNQSEIRLEVKYTPKIITKIGEGYTQEDFRRKNNFMIEKIEHFKKLEFKKRKKKMKNRDNYDENGSYV